MIIDGWLQHAVTCVILMGFENDKKKGLKLEVVLILNHKGIYNKLLDHCVACYYWQNHINQ